MEHLKISFQKLMKLCEKLHIEETVGIAAGVLMALFSVISYVKTDDIIMKNNAEFFSLIVIIRLILLFWNLLTRKKSFVKLSQAIMMIVTALNIYLVRLVIAKDIAGNFLASGKQTGIPSHTVMTVIYGLYAAGKLALWIYSLRRHHRTNLYMETLAFLGWFSALYSMAIFVSYILYSGSVIKDSLPIRIIFIAALLSTIAIDIIMIIRAMESIYLIKKGDKE